MITSRHLETGFNGSYQEFLRVTFLSFWHINSKSDFVDAQCCWGKGPIRRMEILNETQYQAYVYTLQRLCQNPNTESREL